MKQVSNEYKQAMSTYLRNRSHMIVTVGVISNEAQTSAEVVGSTSYISDNKFLFKDRDIEYTYATMEQNFFKCDGSMIFPPERTGYEQLANGISCVSNNLRGSITVQFNNSYDIKGLTITFGEYYPTEFVITTDTGLRKTYTNNSITFTTDDSFDDTQEITITPISFGNGNDKRLRIESMLMGIGLVFQNEDIESASFSDSASFISEELPQLDLSVVCFDRSKRFRVDDSNSFINYLEAGQEITSSIGIELDYGTIEWVNLPKTYLSTWSSDSLRVSFSAVDRFAFFTAKYEGGNYIHERTMYDEAIAVLTDIGLEPEEYIVSDYLKHIPIVNPLPSCSQAEALQLIANASRCLLKQDSEGRIIIEPNFANITSPSSVVVESDNATDWSNPQNVAKGTDIVYADMTNNFTTVNGTMKYLSEVHHQCEDSGYISEQISNGDGWFYKNHIPHNNGWYTNETETQPNNFNWVVNEDNSVTFTVGMIDAYKSFVFVQNLPLEQNRYCLLGFTELLNLPNIKLIAHLNNKDIVLASTKLYEWFNVTEDNELMSLELRVLPIQEEHEDIIFTVNPTLIAEEEYEQGKLIQMSDTPEEDFEYIGIYQSSRPQIKLKFPTLYTYYALNVVFANPINLFVVRTYREGTNIENILVENTMQKQTTFTISHPFIDFDEIVIEVMRTHYPYQRAVIQHVALGVLTEYTLERKNMAQNPIGTIEPKTKTVSVRVFTYENDENNEPKQVEDNVFVTQNINSTGEAVVFENQLISTQEHAQEVAEWIANYYANNITYQVAYRGEPRIESADYLYMDSEILNNLQVEVEEHVLEFRGSIKGQLNLRRAINMVND